MADVKNFKSRLSSSRLFSKGSKDLDSGVVDDKVFNRMTASFEEKKFLTDEVQFEYSAPLIYQLDLLKEDIDDIHSHLSESKFTDKKQKFPVVDVTKEFYVTGTTKLEGDTTIEGFTDIRGQFRVNGSTVSNLKPSLDFSNSLRTKTLISSSAQMHSNISGSFTALSSSIATDIGNVSTIKGDKGDKGDTGAAGAKGDKGDTGSAGSDGSDGAAGAKGDKGDTGSAGSAGAKGDKGDTGSAGAKGDKGDTGSTGSAGAKGDKGDTGAAGADGADGADGTTPTVETSLINGSTNVVTNNAVFDGLALKLNLSGGTMTGNIAMSNAVIRPVMVTATSITNFTIDMRRANIFQIKAGSAWILRVANASHIGQEITIIGLSAGTIVNGKGKEGTFLFANGSSLSVSAGQAYKFISDSNGVWRQIH